MKNGQTYTTPGGSTISWKGNKVQVKEPGQAAQSPQNFSLSASGSDDGNNFALALADSAAGRPAEQPLDWSVWGDPHIQNPNGTEGQFAAGAPGATHNGLFTLQDGTRLLMQAPAANQPVDKVTVFPPGAELTGFDPSTVTNWVDNGGPKGGEFTADGTVAGNYPSLAY
jgi:hypothetical protein